MIQGPSIESPPTFKYCCQVRVKPSMKNNVHLHLTQNGQIYLWGSFESRKSDLQIFLVEPPHLGPVEKGDWILSHCNTHQGGSRENTVQVGHQNKLYFFGKSPHIGAHDASCQLSIYDPLTTQWSNVNCIEMGSSERNRLVVFGYEKYLCFLTPTLDTPTYKLKLFNVETKEWREQKLSLQEGLQNPPPLRSNGTMTVVGNKAVLFGGSRHGVIQNEISILDLKKFQWLNTRWMGEKLLGRTDHAALTIAETQLLIVGGKTQGENEDESFYVIDIVDEENEKEEIKTTTQL
jgi:N-acetylneuraminic acid mutarotase